MEIDKIVKAELVRATEGAKGALEAAEGEAKRLETLLGHANNNVAAAQERYNALKRFLSDVS